MIRWLIQSVADHPALTAGQPPPGLLTPGELAHYHGYHNPRRRRDWLLGRWTAKHLVRNAVARSAGFTPCLGSFSIARAADGAPFVQSDHPALGCPTQDGRAALSLTISHSQDYALAALATAAGEPPRLGVDMERVDRQLAASVDNLLTLDERLILVRASPALRTLMATAIWSAKEAVCKAIAVELRNAPHAVQCILRPGRPRAWQPFLIEVRTPFIHAPRRNQALSGWWRVMECKLHPGRQYVIALAAQGVDL